MPLLNYAILSLLSEKKVDYSLWTKMVMENQSDEIRYQRDNQRRF
jgi:hypothetical protein